jgi:hypothetical protein
MTDFAALAADLDAADELRTYRDQFFGTGGPGHEADAQRPGMPLAYFDGNSLGRPALASIERIESVLRQEWGTRLIRSWDEEWMRLPFELGDKIGRAALGAAPGQTFVADSTSVILFKLARAAIDAQLARDPKRTDPSAPSRGAIVPRWLAGRETTDRFWSGTMLSGYNGFNLIAADFARGECFWGSSLGASTRRLERGVFGVSNASLDTPWVSGAATLFRRSSCNPSPSTCRSSGCRTTP